MLCVSVIKTTIDAIDAVYTPHEETELWRRGSPLPKTLDSWFGVLNCSMFSLWSCPSSPFQLGWAVQTRLLVCMCVCVGWKKTRIVGVNGGKG